MKFSAKEKKCAEWPFGPRSGQESPTLGAESSVKTELFNTAPGSCASTFSGSTVAPILPVVHQMRVALVASNATVLKSGISP